MIPSEIRADFTLNFAVEDAAKDVPTGYTPKLIIGGASSLVTDGAVSGDDITFSLAPSDTTAFTTGQYWYQIAAENGTGDRIFIAEGFLFVRAKITGTGVYDGRSVAEKILEAIDAAMLGKATKDQQSYTIQSGTGTRSLARMDVADLMDARKIYVALVAAEKRSESGTPLFKRHKFAFVRD